MAFLIHPVEMVTDISNLLLIRMICNENCRIILTGKNRCNGYIVVREGGNYIVTSR